MAHSLPTTVLPAFGLSPDDGWRAEHLRTLNNSVFSISRAGGEPDWALRLHRPGWRDATAIESELDLLEHLQHELPTQVRVPRPGRTLDGGYLVAHDGLLYSLFRWLPGTPRRPDTGLNAESTWLLGRGLGLIHSATNHWSPPYAPVEWNASTLYTGASPWLMGADPADMEAVLSPADLDLFGDIAERTSNAFDRLEDWGPIHADYILGNCHWTSIGQPPRLGVLDFNDFGRGPRLFDLGAALGNLADFPDTWDVLAPAFLAGYRAAHDLPKNVVPLLPLMMAARHASHCMWALGHQELGRDWVNTHLRARMEMARRCLAVTFSPR